MARRKRCDLKMKKRLSFGGIVVNGLDSGPPICQRFLVKARTEPISLAMVRGQVLLFARR
jgi:hypothetical protein